jgi:hypothetical protein
LFFPSSLSFSGVFSVLGLSLNRKTGFSKNPVFSGIPKNRLSLLVTIYYKSLFIWKPGWPAKPSKRDLAVYSYFDSKNYHAFIWTSGLARLPRSRLKEPRSRLKEPRSRLPGWKFFHINTHKRASPVARIKVQRYCRKLFLTTVKTMPKKQIVPVSQLIWTL